MISNWIWSDNLRVMFELLGQTAGYVFGESDWVATEFGLGGTNAEVGPWFSYRLVGSSPLDVEVAWSDPVAGGDEVIVRVLNEVDDLVAVKVQRIWSVLNQYQVAPRH